MEGAPARREFVFARADFVRVQRLILERVGIHLADSKQEMVYSRLARRLRALGDGRVGEYLERLEDPAAAEWEHFINALTTNLTAFFREKHHFPVLIEHLLRKDSHAPIRIWCCAASTGEEPYSIAMALRDGLGARRRVELVASDVDTQALAIARAGTYAMERVKNLDRELLRRHFLRGKGANSGRVKVKPELRDMVAFREVNLLDGHWPVEGPLDAIFCRNVFIYFSRDTQGQLLNRFHRLLDPEGLFFAGHSESLLSQGHHFRLLGKTVFAPVHPATVRD